MVHLSMLEVFAEVIFRSTSNAGASDWSLEMPALSIGWL